MVFFRKPIFVIVIFLLIVTPGIAMSNIESSPNYLVLLIHGMGSSQKIFTGESKIALELFGSQYPIAEKGYAGNLKKYLENDLGLAGYVYAYDFSNSSGNLENMGWELGDRNYHNPAQGMDGLCWMEKAKKDFIAANPGKTVPDKFILIGHSMGGMAIRHYLSGKDKAGNPYYQDDVVKVITIGTPHMGTDTANVAKLNEDFWAGTESVVASSLGWPYILNKLWSQGYSAFNVVDIGPSSAPYGQGLDIAHPNNPLDYLDWQTNYLDAAAINSAFISPALIVTIKALFGSPPAVNDLLVDSPIVKELKESKLVDRSIKFRLVGGRGIPTPQYNLTASYLYARPLFGVHPTVAFMTADLWALPTNQQKIEALMLSFSGAVFNQDGDLMVPIGSALALGLDAIKDNDIKTYTYTFKDEELEVFINNFPAIFAASKTAYYFAQMWGTPEWIARAILLIPITSLSIELTQEMDDIKNNMFGHGRILKEVYRASSEGNSIIDQTLDDTPLFGGNTSTTEVKTGISASAVNTPTASFNDYKQAFELLSNLDKESKTTDVYHSVTIEAITESDSNSGMAFPVVVDGTKKVAAAITVKEAPTAVKGVINTYLPLKVRQFQYSENFAAWKDISSIDKWGNFTIKDLKLAEGQNVIAFRAESWTGNKSNQHLKIILNTIPMQPSKLSPLSGIHANNNKITFSGEFGKAAYSEQALENIFLLSGKLMNLETGGETDISKEVETENYGGTYDKHLKFKFTPKEPLPDGRYSLVIMANSNVGVSQAVIDVVIDTQAPEVSIDKLQPYSSRAPAIIKFVSSDEAASVLKNVSCDLYDSNNKLIANIATAETMSKGENFFTLMSGCLNASIPDGPYSIRIKAHDLAGNQGIASANITIDSTSPKIVGLDMSPNPMTSKTTELALNSRVNEPSILTIKMTNLDKGTVTGYLGQAMPAQDGNGCLSVYSWKYDSAFGGFMSGPEDGTYRIEVIAKDEAGNESNLATLEGIVIDRTPPEIYGQITQPYVLANSGKNAYQTTLYYHLKGAEKVKIKVYNSNTGQLVDTIDYAPASNDSENKIVWNANSNNYPKGSYKMQIVAEDKYGNISSASASCVKDGIAPVISYPAEDGVEVFGTISIRGTVVDPDWTNSNPFKKYSVYYRQGQGEWKTDALEVPLANRGSSSVAKNISLKPLQNDSTLAYLDTKMLENGEYTVKVVVEEEGGESISATRVININNESLAASLATKPFVKLDPLQSDVTFKTDDSVKLPISFLNSVKPANAHLEISKMTGSNSLETVFYKYYPLMSGSPLTGKPDYKPGQDLGYFIWKDKDGYHVRWSADISPHKFTGNIIAVGNALDSPKPMGAGVKVNNIISWDTTLSGKEGGIDFQASAGQIMITAKIDEDLANPSVYASDIYFGISKYSQQYLPIMIEAVSGQLMNLGGGAVKENTGQNDSYQLISWDGRLQTGCFADSGAYLIKVISESLDGIGVSTDEAVVNISTPYDFGLKDINPQSKEFSTLTIPDRITVDYYVTKDSYITANVYKDGKFFAKILDHELVLGVLPDNPHSLVWKGNYPDPDSGTLAPAGTYKIVIKAEPKDNGPSFEKTIDNIIISKFSFNYNAVNLEPIGQTETYQGLNVNVASGEAPFYVEAKASGKYFPPKDFSYTLTATAEQRVTTFPYVPFAGLMHRRFDSVDLQVEVTARVHYTKYGYVLFQGWKGEGQMATKTHIQTFSLSNRLPAFEVEQRYDILEFHDAALRGIGEPDGHVDKIGFTLVFRPVRDLSWVIDIATIEADAGVKSGAAEISDKGIFGVYPTWGTWGENFGRRPFFRLRYELEAPIAYSRLTNRFVPWVGFVSATSPKEETSRDFSAELTNINTGLGFPGKAFFDDPDAKPDKPYDPDMVNSLEGIKDWSVLINAVDKKAKQASLLGYKDSLGSSAGYDSYLSDGYVEFIPIYKPDGGDFKYSDNSSMVEVYTDLTYKAYGETPSHFSFNWPLNEQNRKDFEKEQDQRKNEFKNEPTKYSGTSNDGTYWALDLDDWNAKKLNSSNTYNGAGQLTYDKTIGKYSWCSDKNLEQLIGTLPQNLENINFTASSNNSGITPTLTSNGRSGYVEVKKDSPGLDWSTTDDSNLLANSGLMKSGPLVFNLNDFSMRRSFKLSQFYSVGSDYDPPKALFLKHDLYKQSLNSPLDNPDVVIEDWQVNVKNKTGQKNTDVLLEDVLVSKDIGETSHRDNDLVKLKLNPKASESRFVEIKGMVSGPYELMYFDGNQLKTIFNSSKNEPITNGTLVWWDVSRLNGKYTVLLKSGFLVASKDIHIGTLVRPNDEKTVSSTYCRAQLRFSAQAFPDDQLVTITPVTMTEIKLRNRPILITHGPIVEIKPSPWKFEIEPIDKRPTLRFVYDLDELKAEKLIPDGYAPGEGTVPEDFRIPWNIHQVTAGGALEIIGNNEQKIEINSNKDYLYVFSGPLDHFSTYALLSGKISLSAPMVFADRYITNKDSVTIYGTAEPGSIIRIYVKGQDIAPDVEKGEYYNYETIAHETSGKFSVEEVKLLGPDGKNFIFVASHLDNNKNYRTQNSVVVEKDTIPPSIEAKANLAAFSPNSDGKYDSVDYNLKANEKSNIYIQASSLACRQAGDQGIEGSSVSGPVVMGSFSSEAEVEHKLNWSKDGFKLDSAINWPLLVASLADGEYIVTCYAIDMAGNISNNISLKTIVDTTGPVVQGLNADPNPFTPNDDNIKDTTKFWYKLSEPAYVTTIVASNQLTAASREFRRHEAPTENFSYPTILVTGNWLPVTSTGTWEWNGRGSHNELLGGTYTYNILATDWVGNSTSSEVKTVIVDCTPTLVPYLYAQPDPFSPVNPNNNFTDIKYYLARDNTKVNIQVIGQENQALKTLVADDILAKGQHSSRWYGDFDSSYTGPSSSKNKYRVADGSYEFKIFANDITEPGSKTAEVTNTVLVDNVPPQILIKDLKVDYLNKIASLVYSIPETASVEVCVIDNDGKTIASLVSCETQYSGDHSLKYYFGDTVSQQQFKLIAIDKAKNMDEKTSIAFDAIAGQLKIENHKANPSTFTPNSDNQNDLTLISYSLSGGVPEYKTSISILGPSGATIKRLIENETQSSTYYSFYWDGSTSSADGGLRRIASDGYYDYQIIAVDKLGTKIQASGIINLVSTKPSVDINLSTDHFSPNNDGAKDSITFNYSIDYPTQYITSEALIKIEVLNSSNEAVWNKIFNHTAGTYSYEYNGALLPAGDYLVKISGQDGLGTMAEPKTVALIVDYEKPGIVVYEVSPNPFSPNNDGRMETTAVSFGLSKYCEVDVLVLNSSQETIAELINKKPISASGVKISTIPTFVWDGKDTSNELVVDGAYYFKIKAIDRAGNTQEAIEMVEVDANALYSEGKNEPIRNVDIQPKYAKLGSKVTIDFSVAEQLLALPVVYIGKEQASIGFFEKITDTRFDYHYSYLIDADPEGPTIISIEAYDLASNLMQYTYPDFIVDKTSPEVSDFFVSPNPASIPEVSGQVSVKFKVNEELKNTPKVYVTQKNASTIQAAVSGNYEAKFEVIPGYDGPVLITIEVDDLADNIFVYSFNNSLIADTTLPAFSNIRSEVSSNADFSDFAKEASEVKLSFKTSESLKFNPEVKVNNNPANYDGLIADEYTYKYVVPNNDSEGNANISISGFDFAGNEGTTETSLSSESFVIDLLNPQVMIANLLIDMIANPSPFSTNASANAQERRTCLFYETSEYGLVTVKVHKVPEIKKASDLVKADFNDGNLIDVLVNGLWQDGGPHSILWNASISNNLELYDKDKNSLADPGKYAFIVEVRDKAGNVTQKKWGGTVWIQDNCMRLKGPEQKTVNPDPKIISPNGNSPTNKFSSIFFEVDLGVTPKIYDRPEQIAAQSIYDGISWEVGVIKPIGYYTVKIFDANNNLVQAIATDKPLSSGILITEKWEGKDADAQFVANGTYTAKVEIKDFLGAGPIETTLKLNDIIVDNTAPVIPIIFAGPYYFAPNSETSTIKTTTLTYEVSDNQSLVLVNVAVYKGATLVITLVQDALKNNGVYQQVWDGSGSSTYGDGVYTFKLGLSDQAGNTSEVKTADVYIDNHGPNQPLITSNLSQSPTWSKSNALSLSWPDPGDNGGSGVAFYEVKKNNGSYSSIGLAKTWDTILNDGDDQKVAVRAIDKLGNISTPQILNYYIDTTPPYFSSGPIIKSGQAPETWSSDKTVKIEFSGTDVTSQVGSYGIFLDDDPELEDQSSPWGKDLADGKHSIKIKIYDNAGNSKESNPIKIWIDANPPNAPDLTIKHTITGSNGWSNDDKPKFTWEDPGDNGGSGVDHYVGYIDDVSNGNVTSPWHPALSDGEHDVYVKAVDAMGFNTNSSIKHFKIDIQPPYLSQPPSDNDFNPYTEDNTTINFTAYDQGSAGLASLTAQIKYGSNVVKDLVITGNDNNRSITWDGKNNSGDYENEGDYTLEITAKDNANNPSTVKTSIIKLRDDVMITNNAANSNSPYLEINGSNLSLKWVEGGAYLDSTTEEAASFTRGWALGGSDDERYSDQFYIDISQQVTIYSYAWGEYFENHEIRFYPSNTVVWQRPTGTGDIITTDYFNLNPGWYRAYVRVGISGGTGGGGSTTVKYSDYKFNQYVTYSQNYGQLWGEQGGPNPVDNPDVTIISINGHTYQHKVYVGTDNNVYYKRYYGGGDVLIGEAKITNSGVASNPTIVRDNSENIYVAWEDYRGKYKEIYFQKIPSNFAPITGSKMGAASVISIKPVLLSQSLTLESPTLISPDNSANVASIRPTFTWKHQKGSAQEYRIDLAKNDGFSISAQNFQKAANSGSVDKDNLNLFHYTYAIHEFDPGLDKDTYYWKVTALTTNESATSEVRSFVVVPNFALTGVTNYPNPFNPNRETTKIRYRLGSDADSVFIKIYDISGGLVRTIDNCPTEGELSSIWNKYHDVEWDGRNGRGDMVMNGVYVFQITAILGSQSQSATGKAAVLK